MTIVTRHIPGASVILPWADDHKGLTAIVDESDEDGAHILAFCYRPEDAERIKALLVSGESHYAELAGLAERIKRENTGPLF